MTKSRDWRLLAVVFLANRLIPAAAVEVVGYPHHHEEDDEDNHVDHELVDKFYQYGYQVEDFYTGNQALIIIYQYGYQVEDFYTGKPHYCSASMVTKLRISTQVDHTICLPVWLPS